MEIGTIQLNQEIKQKKKDKLFIHKPLLHI
jgi:hypothetical protein